MRSNNEALKNVEELKIACNMTNRGASIRLMIDCVDHVKLIDNIISRNNWLQSQRKLKLCIDVDVSYKPFGLVSTPFSVLTMKHLGVLRSPCSSVSDFKLIVEAIKKSKSLEFSSVMAYEALLSN